MKNIKWPGFSRFLITCAGGVGLLAGIIWLARSAPHQPASTAEPAVSITTIVAERKTIPKQVVFSGQIVGRKEIPIYADLTQGHITQVLVEENQHIKAGTVLATVDASLLQIQKAQQAASVQRASATVGQQETLLEEAQAQYLQAQSERRRGEAVAKTGYLSREVSEQRETAERVAEMRIKAARNGLNMAQADLALVKAQMAETELYLGRTTIRAPVSGTIIDCKANVGQMLNQTADPLFMVLDDDVIEVNLEVSGIDASRLVPGMAAAIQIAGDPSVYPGKIRRAAALIGRQDQVAKVRVRFDKPPKAILGQFAQVSVTFRPKKAIYLPDKAIRFEGESASVFTVMDGKAVRLPVRLGDHSGGLVEVLEGVSAGMPIVDGFAAFLRDGDPVRVAAGQEVGR